MINRNKKEIKLLSKLEKEILTPITFIQGYSAILKSSNELSKSAIDNVNKIERSSERVLNTVQALLMAFEIESKKEKVKLEAIPVLSVTYDVLSKFIRLAKTRKIDFTFSGQSTSNVVTNKKFFIQALSSLSQEILLALQKGNVDTLIKKEGGDILVIFKVVFDQKNQIKISETPGYELAELFLNKSKNKLIFSKKDNLQTITIRLNISE
jgi:signal transduction histidine kinase